jgi:hypothetical protein
MISGGISSEALKMEGILRASLALARADHVAAVRMHCISRGTRQRACQGARSGSR